MADASDIITYIGIPLAVLGVLPILYTFTLSFLRQRRIRALLFHHGHRPVSTSRPNDGFTLRGSPMTGSIEVELPRYTIAPLERQQQEYWQTSEEGEDGANNEQQHLLERGERAETTLSMIEDGRVRGYLRGGSWRAFNWKKLIVGRKLYRIQYEDELREPPAEISFEDLVVFLLDWGAIPDSMGWEKLRSGGLWTPSGTVLLRKPQAEGSVVDDKTRAKGTDWVLRTSMPDESDGILSLTIRWSRDNATRPTENVRGAASLPPGWGRLTQPALLESNEEQEEGSNNLPRRIMTLKSDNKHSVASSSFRFHFEDNRIQRLHWESNDMETGFVCDPFRTNAQSSAGLWFTCATSALATSNSIWAFDVPSEIKTFVRKDSVPCGVMVMLGLLDEDEAPQWSSQKPDSHVGANMAAKHHQEFMARIAAERLEATMPPESAKVHKTNRIRAEQAAVHEAMFAGIAAKRDREERMIKDAIISPRMRAKKVAEACLRWLMQRGEISKEWTVEELAEAVLYLIAVDLQNVVQQDENRNEEREASRIIKTLDDWVDWATAGGMKMQQYRELAGEKEKVAFCFAASLVAVVADSMNSGNSGSGKVAADMLECLKLWRKVRLG